MLALQMGDQPAAAPMPLGGETAAGSGVGSGGGAVQRGTDLPRIRVPDLRGGIKWERRLT